MFWISEISLCSLATIAGGRAGRRDDAEPVGGGVAGQSGFGDGRDVREQGVALRRADAERLQLAGADVRRCVEPIDGEHQLVWPPITSVMAGPAPLNGTCRRSTPAESLNSSPAEMQERADAGGGILQLAGLLLGERDQFARASLAGRSRVGRDHVRRGGEHRNRRERLDGVVGQLVQPGSTVMRSRRCSSVWPSFGAFATVSAAMIAAGAGAVVDDELPAEPGGELRARSGGRRCR